MKTARSIKRFKIPPMDSPCIKEVTTNETSTVKTKEININNDAETTTNSESSSSSSSSSSDHSSAGTPPAGILVGGGGGERRREKAELSSTCVSHGLISVIGRRRVMEDAVTVVIGEREMESYDFFGVYDGHGGSKVANACRERMHQLVAKEVERWRGGGGGGLVDWEKVMAVCFEKMDEEVSGVEENGGGAEMRNVGSTAVVVIVGKEEVVVANCGDSRAVLCRDGVALPLSRDHKPDRPDERERVEAAGGRIVNWNGSRVQGVLATSRSIGDHYLKPYVIPEPEVTVSERTKSDYFLVIASDGLWDVVSNEVACEVVRRCFDGKIRRLSEEFSGNCAAEAAAVLAELAMARGSSDNISVIVVKLKKSICSS